MQTVIGAFDDRDAAQRAVDRLVDAGCDRSDIHVEQSQSTGVSTATDGTQRVDEDRGVLASMGGFFASLFGEDTDSQRHTGRYMEAVRRGSCVVVLDARDESEADRAAGILQELGAINVDERADQWRSQGWNEQEAHRQYFGETAQGDRVREGGAQEGKLDVVEEQLQVGKRAVDRGGVRVIQRVSEKPVRELLRLREERAVVERRPVDREATAEDLANFREGTIEVREMVEEPVVAKTARVVEEVRVGKDVQEREQAIEDTVRRKDVEVQRLDSGRNVERERAVAADRTSDEHARDRESATDKDRLPGGKPRKNI